MNSSSIRKCKLCFKCFPNGRALGGHMRSHAMKLQIQEQKFSHQTLINGENESVSSASYIQDRESETETSKKFTTRKRSQRTRKSSIQDFKNQEPHDDVLVVEAEAEPDSSISDATTEEDVAYCLMMLSRDQWKKNQVQIQYNYELDQEYEDEYDETEESEEENMSSKKGSRGKYKCETCNKVFRSHQALGGHRAGHKKTKVFSTKPILEKVENAAGSEKNIHACPFCSRVFNSGQALGGHKRSHFSNGGGGILLASATKTKFRGHLIDLNLPAQFEDDEFSQVEISAVSDAVCQPHQVSIFTSS